MGYYIVIKTLGLDSLSPDEQVTELVRLCGTPGAQAKLAALTVPVNGVVDDDIVLTAPSFSILEDQQEMQQVFPGTKWCREIFMSDSRVDVSEIIKPMSYPEWVKLLF